MNNHPAEHPIVIPAVEPEELQQTEVDAFILRNREALNASIRQSREELAQSVKSGRTIDDIIADGLRRHGGD